MTSYALSLRAKAELELRRRRIESPVKPIWQPFPDSPQARAYVSLADIIGYGGAAGGGKALSIYGIIPTPIGLRHMGDLSVGDEVFGMDGCIYRIIGTSEVMYGHRVFDVVFDDGVVIRADGDHKWNTFTYAERVALHHRSPEYRAQRRATRAKRGAGKRPDLAESNRLRSTVYESLPVTGGIRTTLEIKSTLIVGSRTNHSIKVAEPLQLPDASLPINPYILGFWLGDGSSYAGRVTIGDEYISESRELIKQSGYVINSIPSDKYGYTVQGLQSQLRELGVLKNKHIPEVYLFGSFEQRQALLCGLMDTDGYATKDGQCEFYNTNQTVIQSVSRLLHTLGIKHQVRSKKPPKNTPYKASYRIKFVAPFPVFRLSAKASRQNMELRETQKWRYIVDVREVDSEPVKCIAVDSPDHLYLAGKECVPTHNTDLALGKSFTQFYRSLILRREYAQTDGIRSRGDEIQNGACTFISGEKKSWDTSDGRNVKVAGVEHLNDMHKYKGRARDHIVFDEASDFLEMQVRFILGWLRTDRKDVHPQALLTFNPPTTPEGEWIIKFFAPWIDPDYVGTKATDGELRWFARIDDKDVEVADNSPIPNGDKPPILPLSRTFFHAFVEDNPVYMATGYDRQLESLPEPLRSQTRWGKFGITGNDDIWQCIPTQWLIDASKRWLEQAKPDLGLRSMGVDPSRGGADEFVIAKLYGSWFAELVVHSGISTPDGIVGAKYVTDAMGNENAVIGLDVIGIGSSVYDQLKVLPGIDCLPINVGAGTTNKDKSQRYSFFNLRSEIMWRFREALDPASGQEIALPPDSQLRNDLRMARFTIVTGKIKVELKQNIKDRIGRSPDRGDAVLLAWFIANRGFSAGDIQRWSDNTLNPANLPDDLRRALIDSGIDLSKM